MASNSSLPKSAIPIVDISSFTSDESQEARQGTAQQIAELGRVNGCLGISGHGVSPALLKEAFGITKQLFDLPYEEKMKAPHPDGPFPHRGYSGIGKENAGSKTALENNGEAQKDEFSKTTDFNESYQIGSEENSVEQNIWLSDDVLPGFRNFTIKLFWELHKVSRAILEALIMSLDLTQQEADNVRSLHTGKENQLRLLHYPPVPADANLMSRIGAHTDWSLFTFLFQDDCGGLEFLDLKTNAFIPAAPKDGVLYMNIGDMFQRLSNGFYPSAMHRVVANQGETSARYSIPYFVCPTPDSIIQPQPSRVATDGKKFYEPVTFTEYSTKMFNVTRGYES